MLRGSGDHGISVGGDLRLPTGRKEDLLGAGRATARALGIGWWEEGRLAAHVNGGIGVGGASRELFWNMATTFAAADRVTVVGEVMGRHLFQLSQCRMCIKPALSSATSRPCARSGPSRASIRCSSSPASSGTWPEAGF